MNIANLNNTNTIMSYKQLSLILTILLLLFAFSFACSPAVNPTDNNDEKTVFTPSLHIKVSDGSTDITDSLSIAVNNSNLITITGLSNAVADKTYTLTITPVPGVFSTQGDSPINIKITEPPGLSPGNGVLSPSRFIITNVNDKSKLLSYNVVVPFSSPKVEEWLTDTTFSTYFTGATYAGQTASLSFDGSTIAIGGDINKVPDGVILITTTTLPSGYTLTKDLIVPDGSGLAALTNYGAGSITITEDNNLANTKEYPVTISLAAYESPVKASHISVIGFDDIQKESNEIAIQIEENIITIFGLINGTSGSGSVTITPPAGEYTVDSNLFPLSFTDREGTNSLDLELDPVSVRSNDITVSHTVKLSLAASTLPDDYLSPVEASHVTAMFNGNTAGLINIEISGTNIIIRGFPNIAGSGSGTVTIIPNADYTIGPDPLLLSFNDPDGTDSKDLTVGIVNVRSADITVLHTIIISFSTLIELTISSDYVVNNPLTISSSDTVNITDLDACELLPPPNFEIDGNTAAVTGFPNYFDRKKDTSTGSDSYTVNRVLILEDATGVLDNYFTVSIENFPACDDASHLSGTGADADNAYEIDSAPKLELLSHLVSSDNANHRDKYYKLTADIDMNLDDPPWSEAASGETGEGFPPIGLSGVQFKGTFDCADNSISNLYINKATGDGIGLFGYTLNAAIQNCSLINVNVSGKNRVGGLAGDLYDSSITNSYATGSVTGTADNVGGLVGRQYGASITNSYATSSVTGTGTAEDEGNVGGLVGSVLYEGITEDSPSIENSYATGNVEGSNSVGGLVGYLHGTETPNITNSYATGNVTGTDFLGGLVGRMGTSSVTNSYSTGSVPGTGTYVGGLVGFVTKTLQVTNSYYDSNTSGTLISRGGSSKTTTDLRSASGPTATIYTTWDTDVWQFDPVNQYPRLKTVTCPNRQYPTDPNNVPTACITL